ncbi:MAG: hypothetical protein ACYTJ0_12995 [Planctomycetota bacterium]|jgi:hypothetical protein
MGRFPVARGTLPALVLLPKISAPALRPRSAPRLCNAVSDTTSPPGQEQSIMPEKDRIDDADLREVAGGRSDTRRTSHDSPIGTPFGDDAIPTDGGSGGKQSLSPEEAASISGGRQAPTSPPNPSLDDDDPPSIRISKDPSLGDG